MALVRVLVRDIFCRTSTRLACQSDANGMSANPPRALILSLLAPVLLQAQDPNLAPDNLKFSRGLFATNHLVVRGTMTRIQQDESMRFQYDRLLEVKRIATQDGLSYAQPKGQGWLKSKDWGKTGLPVSNEKARELDLFVRLAEEPLGEADSRDKSQIWKKVDQSEENGLQSFTYERSPVKAKAEEFYPHYTFIRYKTDTDGKLTLSRFMGAAHFGKETVSMDARYSVMIILPTGTNDTDAEKKK